MSTVPIPLWKVVLRDGSAAGMYYIAGELESWLSLSAVLVHNGVGKWRLVMSADDVSASLITNTIGIVILRNAEVVFSGQAQSVKRTYDTIEITGRDDMELLEYPTRPVPAQSGPPYSAPTYQVGGQASALMQALINENYGVSAPPTWRIPNLNVVANPALGTTVVVNTNGDPLIDVLRDLAVAGGGLSFRLMHSSALNNTLDCVISASVDRSEEIKLSVELRTMEDFEDTWQRPDHNYFIVAADDGFLQDRTQVQGGNSASIAELGRKIPRYVFLPGTTSPTELNQKLQELIDGAVPSRKIVANPLLQTGLEYGEDYNLGDVVSIVVRGVAKVDVIREVQISLSPTGGSTVRPVIGDAGTLSRDPVVANLNAVSTRLDKWQRAFAIPDASVTQSMLVTPPWLVGDVRQTFRATAAPGWLLCQGQSVLRASYPALFTLIGTYFGSTSGAHFTLPDLRERFIMGASGSFGPWFIGGAATIDLRHDHGGVTGGSSGSTPKATGAEQAASTTSTHPISNDLSATQSILPPFVALNIEIYTGV